MFQYQEKMAPARAAGLLQAAEAAARAIPPAFPLTATVAVNPFMGQSGEPLATAAARLQRVAGITLAPSRADRAAAIAEGRISAADLAGAIRSSSWAGKPRDHAALRDAIAAPSMRPRATPTIAELAAGATGIDWPAVINRTIGLWAAGHFDRGQALWAPAPGRGAFAAWREWAVHDLTPEIAGLAGFAAHVAAAPDTAERAILRAADRLGVAEAAAETLFHRLLMDLGGWSQHARWLLWQTEMAGGSDSSITDLLAVRLVWEEALLAHAPQVMEDWAIVLAAHAEPVTATDEQQLDALLQDAAERAYQRQLATALTGSAVVEGRPVLQAAFCIDVRSEPFRRALESIDPDIETIGFAGFFGLGVAHRPAGTDELQPHLPVLLQHAMTSCGHADAGAEVSSRIRARTARAWGRFRQAAVSSFAFVEAAGLAYGWKLAKDGATLAPAPAKPSPAPRLEKNLSPDDKAVLAAAILKAMSMTSGFARLVLLLGHGARMTNNPHESAYHCGACGGQTGEVSARLLALLLNDPQTRGALPAHGIVIPGDTLFVGGLHDTTTDIVTLFDDCAASDHARDLATARTLLATAGAQNRSVRAEQLPGASADTIARRAWNWAEVRPEWGLAGCAAFIAAPRAVTRGRDLGGRTFLHSYDWQADEGFGTLELILTAPVVVASWISLQYFGSTLAPRVFGGGNKLLHNVVGGIGVVEGNGGPLRPGLPLQAVHDGERPMHEPLRLSVLIEAPSAAILDVLNRHDSVRALFDNGWMHLFQLQEGRMVARYRPGLRWEPLSS